MAWMIPGSKQTYPHLAEEFFGSAVAELYRRSGGEGPLRSRLWHGLKPHANDTILEKKLYSAFFPGSSELPALIRNRKIDTVLITGALTNLCCESSARDANSSGLRVIMLADANAARRDQDHNSALHNVYRSFGDVRTTQDVIDLIQADGQSQVVKS